MILYSLSGSYPAPLPFRIILSSGATRTDPATFTPAEIADAGYVEAPAKPSYDPATQRLGWDGSDWTVEDLPPPVPHFTPLTARQLLLALRSIGITADMVDAQINALAEAQIEDAESITDPDERQEAIDQIELERDMALIEWRHASHYERTHPLLDQLAEAFELPPEQVDALWLWAAEL